MSRTIMAEVKREETNARVLAALETGPLTRKQIEMKTGMNDTTIFFCVRRLVNEGRVKLADGQTIKNGGRSGRAALWTLDMQPETTQRVVKSWGGPVSRHPQDVAFYGEYQREAA